ASMRACTASSGVLKYFCPVAGVAALVVAQLITRTRAARISESQSLLGVAVTTGSPPGWCMRSSAAGPSLLLARHVLHRLRPHHPPRPPPPPPPPPRPPPPPPPPPPR